MTYLSILGVASLAAEALIGEASRCLMHYLESRTRLQVDYLPSFQVARRLGMSPRALSLLTSCLNIRVGEQRVDLGLNIKNAPKGLCVPDYAKPQADNQGWLYSQALLQVLEAYKARVRQAFALPFAYGHH